MTSGGGVKGSWNKWRGPACGEEAVYAAKALDADAAIMLCGRLGLGFNPTPCHAASAGCGAAPHGLACGEHYAAKGAATSAKSGYSVRPDSCRLKAVLLRNLPDTLRKRISLNGHSIIWPARSAMRHNQPPAPSPGTEAGQQQTHHQGITSNDRSNQSIEYVPRHSQIGT